MHYITMSRTGFTLVEMLVATMVFVIGFVSVYSLFLAGINYRHESDRLTNTALAATSLISTWRLEMQDQWSFTVDEFVGDGDPSNGPETAGEFFPYPDDQGIWYRIDSATDAAGQTGAGTDESSGIRIVLLLIDAASNPVSLNLTEIKQRHFVDPTNNADYLSSTFPNTIEDPTIRSWYATLSTDEQSTYILEWRKILSRHEAVILRR